MHTPIKSLILLVLFSTFLASCASTQEDIINSKMSGFEKEKKEKEVKNSSTEFLRTQVNRFERFERYDR